MWRYGIILILAFTIYSAKGQQAQNPAKTYRIVAVQAKNNTIQSVSNEVNLYLPVRMYLPSAFTPNNDGLNDTFGIVGEGIESCRLIVYNRWGEIVFSSERVDDKWDGKYKGKLVPFGAYSYEVVAFGKEFGKLQKSGNILVLQ
jgi:gliding motility-associated-like protein